MSILIKNGGIFSTIQDLGRSGFRRLGINPGGVMDTTATRLINILVGNDESEGVLEMHFPAAGILFEEPAMFAIGGADLSAQLDGKPVENWRRIFAGKNSVLTFKEKIKGSRAYLSVQGGFRIADWLGSTSTNIVAKLGGFEGRALRKGDRLFLNSRGLPEAFYHNRIAPSLLPRYGRFPTVRVTAGAGFGLLNALGQETLLKENFTISPDSDRMGFRLQGKPLYLLEQIELVSSATGFGTVQLLPSGQLIVLMADAQTSGGYPRLAHVASIDLPLLAQLGANDKVAFHLITVSEAEDLVASFERDINFFKVGCRLM